MLEIRIKPTLEALDLAKKVTINTVKESPIFQAEIKQSSISYSFTIGYTNRNARLLKLPAELESPDVFETFDVFLVIENSYEIDAVMEVLEVLDNKNGKFIKLKLDAVDFPADFLQEELSSFTFDEISMGTTTQDVKDHAADVNTKSYDDTSHVFPMIYNEDYYNGNNADWKNVINNFNIDAEDFIDNADSPVRNRNVLIPYFFLLWIFKEIFQNNGITLKGNFMDDPEMQKLIVHNNYGLDEFDIERTFVRAELTSDAVFNVVTPVVYKKNDRTIVFDDDSTFPNEDTDAIYNTGTGSFVINQIGILKASIFNLVVEMHQWGDGYTTYNDSNTSNFITKFFVCVEIDGVLRSEWSNWELTSGTPPVLTHVVGVNANGARVVSFPAITLPDVNLVAADIGKSAKIMVGCYYYTLLSDIPSYTGPADNRFITVYSGAIAEMNLEKWSELNVYSKSINPANHMPNMTAENFVNAYIKSFRIMPIYNKLNKELHLNYFKDIAGNHSYDDITDNVSSRTIKKLDYTGFNLRYNTDSDDLIPEKSPGITQFIYIGEFDIPSNLPTPGSVSLLAYVQNENAWYLSKVTTGITFERYKEGFDALLIGDGSEEYIIDWSPFLMKYQTIDNTGGGAMREFLLPNISETGSSLYFDIGINDPQFKTLIWHGMVDGPIASKPYPFASSYNIDHNGNTIGDLTLKLSNEEGSLYYDYLKDYFNFLLTTKKVEHVYTTNLKHPLNYNFFEKKLIINQRFLTGKLKLKITNTGFESIIAENYTT